MKKIILFLGISLLLTGCFGWDKENIEDRVVVIPEVLVENTGAVDTVEEILDTQTWSSDETGGSWVEVTTEDEEVSEEEKQVEAEVIGEFESDLDEIFKDLGV